MGEIFIVLSFQGLEFPVDPISSTEQVTENFQSFANPSLFYSVII